jgi:hypothetical protein
MRLRSRVIAVNAIRPWAEASAVVARRSMGELRICSRRRPGVQPGAI